MLVPVWREKEGEMTRQRKKIETGSQREREKKMQREKIGRKRGRARVRKGKQNKLRKWKKERKRASSKLAPHPTVPKREEDQSEMH